MMIRNKMKLINDEQVTTIYYSLKKEMNKIFLL